MYTPQEVSEKTFPKSSGLSSGYSMTAVDEFLDGLTEDYTALYKDNTTLKAKLKVLAEKVEEYRATEDAMRSTLLAAQKMAAQMVAEAQAERDKSIAEAHAEKEKTISNAQAEAQRILIEARGEAEIQARQLSQEMPGFLEKLAAAQSETESFIQRSRELCAQQMAFLDALPERNAPEQEEQSEAVALPCPPRRTPCLWRRLRRMRSPASQEEPSQEQQPTGASAAEEKPQEKKEEDSPFPLDFKLNLEDLQFGRNYNGGDRR